MLRWIHGISGYRSVWTYSKDTVNSLSVGRKSVSRSKLVDLRIGALFAWAVGS